MSQAYKAVGWNRQKKIYDRVLVGGVALFLVLFIGISKVFFPTVTVETLIIRGFATAALVLLHIIMTVGPMARLDRRWLPLLYNRRHMGVTMFLLAFVHGAFSVVQFHALGDMKPLVSLFVSNTRIDSIAQFPFQPLGFFALVILFLMAATSHDFWLANLGAPIWKALHMLVYVAYALIIAHVALGYLQTETSPVLSTMLVAGALWICLIHVVAGYKERPLDTEHELPADEEGFLNVFGVDEIAEKRGRMVTLSGDRVAVFKYDGKISAISNACQHQNGPLGEGRIIDGFVTCPWHGYQYQPETGASPPPFTEKVPTFNVKVHAGRIWVHPTPNPAGTRVEPALIQEATT
jgi:nitrite reductase/ring-hydroxylating ferredoxin subunit/DMSO/TMAO reductase YedYZ heme-binding membrane subunit